MGGAVAVAIAGLWGSGAAAVAAAVATKQGGQAVSKLAGIGRLAGLVKDAEKIIADADKAADSFTTHAQALQDSVNKTKALAEEYKHAAAALTAAVGGQTNGGPA